MVSKYFEQFIKFFRCPPDPAAIIGVALYTVFIMSVVSAAYAGNMKWGVYSGSQLVTMVEDPAEARNIISRMTEQYTEGEAAVLLGKLYLKKTNESGPVISGYALQLALNDAVTSRVRGSEIMVDGKALLALKSREDAEKLLAALRDQYAAPGSSVSFMEDVKIVDAMVEKIRLMSVETAMEVIRGGAQKTALYEVKEGDTLWDIAGDSGLTVDDILDLNPGMDPEALLQLGDKINLSKSEPLINVKTVTDKTVTETVEPPLEERRDSSLYLGEKKLLAGGKSGKREVTYQIVCINGLEMERSVLQEEILEKAEPKIVATGTRTLLASRGSGGGRLNWPTVGSVISPYGKRGGRLHAGVDINAGYGSAVTATQSGTVIRAGWYSGYGKCIDISHGDGIVSRYGHLSGMAVSVGQKVSRGQFIGRVGATGRATGPHLHFEILVNGHPRNPMTFF